MWLKKLKAEGLAHHTYMIGSGGEAVVIDPRREPGDVEACLGLARDRCLKIGHVLETHRNEDFVHGSQEIARATRASIRHGKRTPFKYGKPVGDGETIAFGGMTLRALETPGHTPESLTFVLYDEGHAGTPLVAFTGDALFVGSTGRVDLAGPDRKAGNAGELYDSIHRKILPLGDHVLLCPAHGAGSVCGAGIGDRDWSTLGYEKLTSPHLQLDRAAFVERKAGEKLTRPPYFSVMEQYNLNGPPPLAGRTSLEPMGLRPFRALAEDGEHEIVDTRMPPAYGGGHVPGSYSVWPGGMALFPGWLFGPEQRLLLLADRDEDAAVADRLLCRIGFDQVEGFLCGGFESWQNAGLPVGHTGEVSVEALRAMLDNRQITLVDVREPHEWEEGVIAGSLLIHLGELRARLHEIPADKPVAVTCSVGRRGSVGASVLQKAGIADVYNVLGGTTAWSSKGYPLVKPG